MISEYHYFIMNKISKPSGYLERVNKEASNRLYKLVRAEAVV